MPIPTTRTELVDQVVGTYRRLQEDIAQGGPAIGNVLCVDEWTVKDVLAVRAWWTHSVIDWVETGAQGGAPTLPAEGYRWNETPRLNGDIVREAAGETLSSVLDRLDEGFGRVVRCIDTLSDSELLEARVFPWAGKWPISRWISINTARQYATARTYVRRCLRSDS